MLRKFFLVAAGCFAALALTPSFAAPTPTITISGNGSIALALAPLSGPDAALVTKTIQNDLALSGFFSLTDANRATMTIKGDSSGSALQGKVVDRSGSNVLLRTYAGGAKEKAHAFANDIIETLTGSKGMAGSKIAFISTRSGNKELYTADYDGSNVNQITHDNTISVAPALSPDGRRIAYTSYLHGYADIYTIDLASKQRDRIVKYPGTNSGAAFSPDGSQIACTVSRDGNPELYVVGASGSGARRLTHTPGVESTPSWSPDGSEIVYSSDDTGSPQLFRISASGGSGRRLATGHSYCTKPSWSPDGKKIAFNIRDGGSFQVAVLDLASGNVRVVTSGDEARDPVWGPDSRHLLFTQSGSLMLFDIQTARKVALLSGLGSVSEPTWSR
ncbi:MAG: biopolymer transporter Tol [Verrucomicrobiota bacterium]